MQNDLTTEKFWSDFWSNLKLPITVDWNFKNDKVIANEIINSVPRRSGLTALEVGCAPGKWLSFLAKELNCTVTGIEYVQIAADKTKENLELQHVENFKILNGDFFNYKFNNTYDIVISLGFIEHFSYFEKVLEDQLKLVSPEGYLIVGIPRFKGVNFLIQSGIDKFIKNKLIPSHNLEVMSLEVFERFATRHGLEIKINKFIGGFESGLFPVGEIKKIIPRVFFKIVLRALNFILGDFNSKLTSSYQIAILKK